MSRTAMGLSVFNERQQVGTSDEKRDSPVLDHGGDAVT